MARRARQQAEAPGQDSFLDVIANLVGVMIILIIVVGFATKKAMVQAGVVAAIPSQSTASDSVNESWAQESDRLRSIADGLARDLEQTEANLRRDLFEIKYRQIERDKLLTRLSVAQVVVAERRDQLDEQQQARFDLASKLDSANAQLESLTRQESSVKQDRTPAGVIEHLPTPMAKTVFGKEYHYRLNGGRIVQVPWDALLEKLAADARQKAQRLKDSPTITETIGPIQGFWMKYTLRLTTTAVAMRGGTVQERRVQLDRFVMVPVSDEIGEPMAEALGPNSDFSASLKGLHPERSTITVWVYPDSFNEYRELKKSLFARGFLTAARPMPADQPLGGAPDGVRSTAQ